jgi:hypothetical protein
MRPGKILHGAAVPASKFVSTVPERRCAALMGWRPALAGRFFVPCRSGRPALLGKQGLPKI